MSDNAEHVRALSAMRSMFSEKRIPSPCEERDALDAAILALSPAAAGPQGVVGDEMVTRAMEAMNDYWAEESLQSTCDVCKGSGEDRANQDWCGDCGGQGLHFSGDEAGAMRAALTAALHPPTREGQPDGR